MTWFLAVVVQASGNGRLAAEYGLLPFEVNVLDKRRTLTEKLVSLLRCSLADLYVPQLAAKIRHFYDLHHLLRDGECCDYLYSAAFSDDFRSLFDHDRQSFDKPEGWLGRNIRQSPLMVDWPGVWNRLKDVYRNELPDLAYRPVPDASEIETSIRELMEVVRSNHPDD